MAKSVKEYYDLLIAEKEQSLPSLTGLQPIPESSQTLLNDLTTGSRVSRWRLMVWLMAFALYMHETIIEQLAASTESGTPLWYRKKALAFQYGDALEIVNNTPQYPVIEPSHQIVKLAALVINSQGELVFKVSKLDSSDEPEPLTVGEQVAFSAYMDQIKFAGTLTNLISQPADDFKVSYRIIYDPLLMQSDGSLINASGVFPVKDAIDTYLKNLPYNGFLYLDKLDDSVQAAQGVIHAVRISAFAKRTYDNASAYIDIQSDPYQRYNPEAGYLRVANLTLTYVPES